MAVSDVHDESAPTAPPARGMRVEAWIFLALTGFFFIATCIYAFFAGQDEPVGVVALALTTGLSLIIGTFLLFSARRLEAARPEDNENADVADGAGDLGTAHAVGRRGGRLPVRPGRPSGRRELNRAARDTPHGR